MTQQLQRTKFVNSGNQNNRRYDARAPQPRTGGGGYGNDNLKLAYDLGYQIGDIFAQRNQARVDNTENGIYRNVLANLDKLGVPSQQDQQYQSFVNSAYGNLPQDSVNGYLGTKGNDSVISGSVLEPMSADEVAKSAVVNNKLDEVKTYGDNPNTAKRDLEKAEGNASSLVNQNLMNYTRTDLMNYIDGLVDNTKHARSTKETLKQNLYNRLLPELENAQAKQVAGYATQIYGKLLQTNPDEFLKSDDYKQMQSIIAKNPQHAAYFDKADKLLGQYAWQDYKRKLARDEAIFKSDLEAELRKRNPENYTSKSRGGGGVLSSVTGDGKKSTKKSSTKPIDLGKLSDNIGAAANAENECLKKLQAEREGTPAYQNALIAYQAAQAKKNRLMKQKAQEESRLDKAYADAYLESHPDIKAEYEKAQKYFEDNYQQLNPEDIINLMRKGEYFDDYETGQVFISGNEYLD